MDLRISAARAVAHGTSVSLKPIAARLTSRLSQNTGAIIRRRLTPAARAAVISQSDESRPNPSSVANSMPIGSVRTAICGR
jgi:hypothetical protein